MSKCVQFLSVANNSDNPPLEDEDEDEDEGQSQASEIWRPSDADLFNWPMAL